MGAGGSVPTNSRNIEPPPLPPPFLSVNSCYSGNARLSGVSDETQDSRASTVTLGGPRSQGPSPYATLRREEWWHHRPSAPSLPNLHPQQETLLTYAAQMTGWQASEGSSSSATQNEAMELSRTISHLAAANQQLATAHGMALAHLEALYLELRKEKELRQGLSSSDRFEKGSRKKLAMEGEEEVKDEEKRDMRIHIARLEASLEERSNFFQSQRNLQWEEEKKLRAQLERLESLLASKDEEKKELKARLETLEGLLASRNDEDVEDDEKKQLRSRLETLEVLLAVKTSESAMDPLTLDYQRALAKIEYLEQELRNSVKETTDDSGSECHRADRRNQFLEKELEVARRQGDLRSVDSSLETKYNVAVDRLVGEQQGRIVGQDHHDGSAKMMEIERTNRLLEEIEKLKTDRLESQEINRRLKSDLENQKRIIEKLREDYKVSKMQYEKVELNLIERKEQFDKLSEDFNLAKQETLRLLRELDAFHLEKDTANVRISNLEQDLQKSMIEREQIKSVESQKSSKLRARLSEEVSDKKKQIRALEDALEEIQRLKKAVKAEKKDNSSVEEDVSVVESVSRTLDSVEETSEDTSSNRSTNMEEFKKELTLKREARQRAIAAVSSEMDRLRRELDAEKEAHSQTSTMLELLKSGQTGSAGQSEVDEGERDGDTGEMRRLKRELKLEKEAHEETLRRVEAQRLTDTLKISDELKNDIRFQTEKLDDLRYQLECEPDEHQDRILSLKELADASRQILGVRERQTNKLKDLLAQILARLGDRSFLEISGDVRSEYDHQLQNIRKLKTLYDERLKVLTELKDSSVKELTEVKEKLENSRKKCEGLEEDLKKADEKIDAQDTEISNLESQLGLTKADCRDLQNQMSVINSLFTQMLLSASSADMDLDRLTRLLQENHDLISDMAREEGTEAAALPKLLLDLIEQVEGCGRVQNSGNDAEKKEEDLQEENIAHNLPKVWRVLLELLSCHAVEAPSTSTSSSTAPDCCYKSVDTPTGPRLVISVSKTYIRLKELILEKKHLEKEMNRMKQLNTHLESKLGEQEKRLSTVSAELSKTWNIVGRMQAQHQQLHTHEKILRYELQQKRKMLQELKQELEYCREKWESARQKNTNTELEWRSLRREFAARKALAVHDSFNNSGESGFSDERGDDSDEEDESVEERLRISSRRRARKESPRVPTPDTESEQPTDTELSESKIGSLNTPKQRTPTPETEAEVDAEVADADAETDLRPATPEPDCTPDTEPLNPLDRALTNVIQNLIKIDNTSNPSTASTSRESLAMPSSGTCGFKESSSLGRSKSGSPPKRRNSKWNVREWSPHSEPWSSRIGEFDLGSSTLKKSSKTKNSAVGGSTPDLGSFSAISRPIENSLERIGKLSPSTSDSSLERLEDLEDGERSLTKIEEPSERLESPVPTVSVFSIGPFPTSKSPSPIKSVQFSDPLIMGPSNNIFAPVFGGTTAAAKGTIASGIDNTRTGYENVEEKSLTLNVSTETEHETKSHEDKLPKTMDTFAEVDNVSIESSSSLETVKEFQTISSVVLEATSSLASVDRTSSMSRIDGSSGSINSISSNVPREPESSSISRLEGVEATTAFTVDGVAKSESKCSSSTTTLSRSSEEVLAARAARLKRLEEQADWLMKKMNATSQRGSALSTRLEELHEVYGEPPVPPPLPDVLPSVRLQTDLELFEMPRAPPMPTVLPTRRLSTEMCANESPPDITP